MLMKKVEYKNRLFLCGYYDCSIYHSVWEMKASCLLIVLSLELKYNNEVMSGGKTWVRFKG